MDTIMVDTFDDMTIVYKQTDYQYSMTYTCKALREHLLCVASRFPTLPHFEARVKQGFTKHDLAQLAAASILKR